MTIEWTLSDDEHRTQHAEHGSCRGYVAAYTPRQNDWNWQAYLTSDARIRISGSAATEAEARAASEFAMAAGQGYITAKYAKRLASEIDEKIAHLAKIAPDTADHLHGYRAGYQDGQTDLRARIATALGLSDEQDDDDSIAIGSEFVIRPGDTQRDEVLA